VSISTNQVALLAVMVSLVVPFLVEILKKRFGKEDARQRQDHDKHSEIMAELAAARGALAAAEAGKLAAEKSETEWQAKYQDSARREIALLKDVAGKEMLISKLTTNLPKRMGEGRKK